ncbi:NAD-dependent deacylase [Alicyclobacillus sp. SO9]|nr:NAD-dependent deacylase [Alicyclobacillus sp. SO9]
METLALWMQRSQSTVILTGAGISTESGVPDYRSEDGWWNKVDPLTISTASVLSSNYDLFHEFYSSRLRALGHVQPNRGHQIISDWEERGLVHTIATQNVDGLHQLAGSTNVTELHGTIRRFRCSRCDATAELEEFLNKEACVHCGGNLRPNVILFQEMLPQGAWDVALRAITNAHLVLVIGTSLQVSPVNQLPSMTAGKIAVINMEETDFDHGFDLVIHGTAGEILEQVNALIMIPSS